jgi:peptidoglycan hydrolase-like protein with peptidoglycan-binding domain
MALVCWKGEKWNGMGPRNRGIFTGYLWSGTNHYTRGKYVSDGVWDANVVDKQLGIISVLYQMNVIDRSNYIGVLDPVDSDDPPPVVPTAAPFTLVGTVWLQSMLNILMPDDEDLLRVDGDYGRNTTAAVRNFQAREGLEIDGDAGELTTARIDLRLSQIKI